MMAAAIILVAPATHYEQMWNIGLQKNNTSGFRGVWRTRNGKWSSEIVVNYLRYYLGIFDTPEEASAAYESAAREVHGEFYRQPAPTGSVGS